MTQIRNQNGILKVSGNMTGLQALKLKGEIRVALKAKETPIVDLTNAYPVGFMALHILKEFCGLITVIVNNRPEVMALIDVMEMDEMVIGS